MKNVLDYLTWEHVELGVRITGCDNRFEGALEIPSLIDGVAVVEIGWKAFADCELEELHLRAGIKKIEDSAFASCESLKSVEIPGSVESVGVGAFSKCAGLEELRLGTGIKEIGKDAFDPHVTLVVDADSYAEEWCIEHHPDYDVR